MKRLRVNCGRAGHLTCVLLLTGAAFAGCGSEDPPADPDEVIDRAYADLSSPAVAGEEPAAEVVVASLGFEDQSLQTRTLSVEPGTYTSVREAITGSAATEAEAVDGEARSGLLGLSESIESEGTEDLDGVEVDHVSGSFDVGNLVDTLTGAIESGDTPGGGDGLPGLGDLEQLQETLTEANFDLYVATGEGSFERLDLTLSLDDRENALPPTRIRFSLTEAAPTEATP